MEDLRATVYSLVKEWSETKGLDPQLVLMSAGAATLIGACEGMKEGGRGRDAWMGA